MGTFLARVVESFNVLINFDAENVVKDKYLMYYWGQLYGNIYHARKWSSDQGARIFERVFRLAEEPYTISGNSAKDFLMYIYYLNIAKYMHVFE